MKDWLIHMEPEKRRQLADYYFHLIRASRVEEQVAEREFEEADAAYEACSRWRSGKRRRLYRAREMARSHRTHLRLSHSSLCERAADRLYIIFDDPLKDEYMEVAYGVTGER